MVLTSIREKINKSATLGGAVVTGLALLTVGVLYYRGSTPTIPPFPAKKMFFVDLSTGEEYVKTSYDVPPLMNGKGEPTIVGAVYYTFDGGATRRLAYYQKFTPEAKTAYSKLQQNPAAGRDPQYQLAMDSGTLIRDPDLKNRDLDEGWVAISSPEAGIISGKAARPPATGGMLTILKP